MNANNFSNYLIYPGQVLKIPSSSSTTNSSSTTASQSTGYSSPTFNHQNLYTAVNVRGMYLIVALKLDHPLVHIGLMLSIGLIMRFRWLYC